jgi:hypothetical protein
MYIDIFRRLRNVARRKRTEQWKTNSCFLLHDNAPVHWSDLVNDLLAKKIVTTLAHLPYSPDLAKADFYLFPLQK